MNILHLAAVQSSSHLSLGLSNFEHLGDSTIPAALAVDMDLAGPIHRLHEQTEAGCTK